ncbi:DNA-directed RNA polymerase [Brucella intermedia]|uniref:DNA-directed RNA polymerase n=1 Tax=Brucella intermedia TaxID=94625 RepID=UPI00224B72CD|nr:DNA-directed RNA polymerase [Brucella intermedia]
MTIHVQTPAYLHPRWDDQVALEKEMLETGKERMKSRIDKAKEKRDMNRLRPYRSLLHEWVLPVSDAVKVWIKRAGSKRGVRPIALPRLQELSPETAAMVALKTMLRMLGIERRGILAVAVEIGTWCEHEARCQKWQEEDPEDWKLTSAHFNMRGSNAAHQRRSRISLFNKYVWERIGWIAWTDTDRQRVGLELINIVIETTRRFFIMPDPSWTPKRGKGGAYLQRPYVLDADPELLDWLTAAMDDELVHAPVFMPTLIPPLDWTGPRDGGYYTPFVKTPFLIRFKANHQEQQQNAIEEYEALDMPDVYRAINLVQSTPWKINERVLKVAEEVWEKDLAWAGLPRREAEFVPPRPEGVDKESQEYKDWAKAAGEANTRNAKRVSRIISYRRCLVLAARFRNEPEFYFPHMLDFRGRMYPIPSDLSPQGEDLHRGLLMFAKGKPVDEEDSQWLAIHLANTFGYDKAPYWERIEWVKQREALWKRIDQDPMSNREWIGEKDKDEHWQRLAAVFEWARWLREGPGMVSSLPVRVDGTCNGIQHLSAMVRDEVGGASVNLIPGERPRDIYQEVADILTEELQDRLPHPMAKLWLDIFEGKAPRSVTKRPVMILPYGGTRHAYFGYTMDWLKETDEHGTKIPVKARPEAVTYLVPILWKAVEKTVIRAREVMGWLQECAKAAGHGGTAMWWKTPAGFFVRQFYGTLAEERIKTSVDGQTIWLRNYTITNTLNLDDQLKAIAPNFVHSMDASALMTCAILAAENGVESFTSIHDAYGTVAADMWTLNECIREAFLMTYQQPVLEMFRNACLYVAGTAKDIPPVPASGLLNLSDIKASDYFFA